MKEMDSIIYDFTCEGVRSNNRRVLLSRLWAQTHDRPRPIQAVDPVTTSAIENTS